jgi:glycolate oxidase
LDTLYTRAFELGGVVSGEHGIGHAKKAYLKQALGQPSISLMRGIKAVFDPTGILNPGKIMD